MKRIQQRELQDEVQRLINMEFSQRVNEDVNATTEQLLFFKKKLSSNKFCGLEKFVCDIAGPKSKLMSVLDSSEMD